MLFNEDCLIAMKQIKDESVDLVYLDPPFFTQKIQKLKNKEGYEYSFNDSWDSLSNYLKYIKDRLYECKRVLKKTGSIYLHCDNKASHHLRILLDEVFGDKNFRSEIIWMYKRWSNSKKGLLNSHQTIFFYSKGNNYKFNRIYTDYSPTTNIDQILQDRVRNSKGKTIYKTDEDGQVVCSNEKIGVPLTDVWEIPFLNPKAKERVGYPTQKPILLLEKIIEISTEKGDIVLDPFCGSGTTLVASLLMDREYIGIDISNEAISISKKRLQQPVKTKSRLLDLGTSVYEKKTEYEKNLLNCFECNIVQRNKGIDAFLKKMYLGSPVAIRIQKDNESIFEAIYLLNQASLKKKCKYSILIRTSMQSDLDNTDLPSNIVILDSYRMIIEQYIKTEFKQR